MQHPAGPSPAVAPRRGWSRAARAAVLGIAVAASGCASGDPPRPNVVLVSIDTLRADRLGAYGYTARALSPTIDGLAAEGILFERCSTTSPWTTPAHASLFTARFPSSHGLTRSLQGIRDAVAAGEGFQRLPHSRTTLAEVLAGEGYATAAFTGGVTLDPILGLDQGFDRYETGMFKLDARAMEDVERWLDEVRGEPFFLFWHTFEVHAPFLDTRYLAGVLGADRAAEVGEAIDAFARTFHAGRADGEGLGIAADIRVAAQRELLAEAGVLRTDVVDALYCGGVASVDGWLAKLFDALRERGLYEDALIVVTSDHGEELAERDERMFYNSHGHQLYEELVHVPLVVKLPDGAHAGARVGAVASLVDVMPTVLDLARVRELPDGVQGESLRPDWEGGRPAGERERTVAMESLVGRNEKKAVRQGAHKYIVSIGAREVRRHGRRHVPERALRELFDLARDPGERQNLLLADEDGRHARVARRLEERLREVVAAGDGEVESVEVGEGLLEGLEALGYGGVEESGSGEIGAEGERSGAGAEQGAGGEGGQD